MSQCRPLLNLYSCNTHWLQGKLGQRTEGSRLQIFLQWSVYNQNHTKPRDPFLDLQQNFILSSIEEPKDDLFFQSACLLSQILLFLLCYFSELQLQWSKQLPVPASPVSVFTHGAELMSLWRSAVPYSESQTFESHSKEPCFPASLFTCSSPVPAQHSSCLVSGSPEAEPALGFIERVFCSEGAMRKAGHALSWRLPSAWSQGTLWTSSGCTQMPL